MRMQEFSSQKQDSFPNSGEIKDLLQICFHLVAVYTNVRDTNGEQGLASHEGHAFSSQGFSYTRKSYFLSVVYVNSEVATCL
jgi:hypothetical protein